jgi:GntR family transcriptional regulator
MDTDFSLSQTDGRPMYRQIMEQIKQRVAVGNWPAGEKLPSIRELAVALRVSVITVKRAYLELEREGMIITQHGRGSFVAEDSEIGSRLRHEELEEQLAGAVRSALLLGLRRRELVARLEAAHRRMTGGNDKEEV